MWPCLEQLSLIFSVLPFVHHFWTDSVTVTYCEVATPIASGQRHGLPEFWRGRTAGEGPHTDPYAHELVATTGTKLYCHFIGSWGKEKREGSQEKWSDRMKRTIESIIFYPISLVRLSNQKPPSFKKPKGKPRSYSFTFFSLPPGVVREGHRQSVKSAYEGKINGQDPLLSWDKHNLLRKVLYPPLYHRRSPTLPTTSKLKDSPKLR